MLTSVQTKEQIQSKQLQLQQMTSACLHSFRPFKKFKLLAQLFFCCSEEFEQSLKGINKMPILCLTSLHCCRDFKNQASVISSAYSGCYHAQSCHVGAWKTQPDLTYASSASSLTALFRQIIRA